MSARGNHFEEPRLNEQLIVCVIRFFACFGDFRAVESHIHVANVEPLNAPRREAAMRLPLRGARRSLLALLAKNELPLTRMICVTSRRRMNCGKPHELHFVHDLR